MWSGLNSKLFFPSHDAVILYVVTVSVQAPHTLYKPNKDLVKCNDTLCASLHWPSNKPCVSPNDQCDYDIQYADYGSSMGVLIRDTFPLRFTNGSVLSPNLTFGWVTFCG